MRASRDASYNDHRSAATHAAIVHLLEDAGLALAHNRALARSLIEKASALLRAQSDELAAAGPVPCRGGLAPWQAQRVVSHIEARLGSKIRIQELASLVRLSSGYFARAFRRSFDETPYRYIVRRRLERAQETMLASDRGLSEIAFACGFSDQAHMTKLFHQIVGESPGAWRRNHGFCAERSRRHVTLQASPMAEDMSCVPISGAGDYEP